jgi:hypothetical protein
MKTLILLIWITAVGIMGFMLWEQRKAATIHDTFERAQDADVSHGDPDDDLNWLRNRSQ